MRVLKFFTLFASALVAGSMASAIAHPEANSLEERGEIAKKPLTHIVLFEFTKDAPKEKLAETNRRMLALKEDCKNPKTGKPYILSAIGGIDISAEPLTYGMTHGFVMEFANTQDRDYYTFNDPAHKSFQAFMKDILVRVQVVDFFDRAF